MRITACPVIVDGARCNAALQATVTRETWYDAPSLEVAPYAGDGGDLYIRFDPDEWVEHGGETTGDRYYCANDHDEIAITDALKAGWNHDPALD